MSTRTRRRSSGSAAIRSSSNGIQVLPAALPAQHPALVVHAGRPVGHLVERDADQLAQVVHRPVHRVTQPEHLQLRGDGVQVGDVHGHRVGVVEQPGVRADLRHVPGDLGQHGEGPQAAEDAADPDRVGDRLVEPEAGRDLEVADGGLVQSHLDHVDHVVGTVERARDARTRPRSRGWAPTSRAVASAIATAVSSRSGSMSCSTTRASASSGKENTSPSRSRVNTTLPAPMMAIVAGMRRD